MLPHRQNRHADGAKHLHSRAKPGKRLDPEKRLARKSAKRDSGPRRRFSLHSAQRTKVGDVGPFLAGGESYFKGGIDVPTRSTAGDD